MLATLKPLAGEGQKALVCKHRDPRFWPTESKFCGKFESEARSAFRARNGELKRFRCFMIGRPKVSVTEG